MKNNMENPKSPLEIAQENFKMWNNTLLTKDAKKVAELYSEDATFHPTMSGDFKLGQEGAGDYFEHFLLKNPVGKVVEEKVQPIGDDSYLHSGLYNFEIGPTDKRETAKARFTYLWKKDKNGQWKIAHHHSSVLPN